MVHAGTQDDHGSSLGLGCVLGELAANASGCLSGDSREGLLPSGCSNGLDIVVACGPLTGDTVTAHAVLGEQDVVDGGEKLVANLHGWDAAANHTGTNMFLAFSGRQVEPGEQDLFAFPPVDVNHRQVGLDALHLQVPLAHAIFAVVVSERPTRVSNVLLLIPDEGAELSVLGLRQLQVDAWVVQFSKVRGRQELAGNVSVVVFLQLH